MMENNTAATVKFAKMHPDAKIPTKEYENAGYDIYPAFDEDFIQLSPCETKMIPTGICSAFPPEYVMILKERGSTGTKGIGQRSGVIDSGYRGQWFVPITNHNNFKVLFISKLSLEETARKAYAEIYESAENIDDWIEKTITSKKFILYPYEKAIAQAILLPVPKTEIIETTVDEIINIESNRGTGALGSSGK